MNWTGLLVDSNWSPSLTLEPVFRPRGCVSTSQSAVIRDSQWTSSSLTDGIYVIDVHSGNPSVRRGRLWVAIGDSMSSSRVLPTLQSKYGENVRPFAANIWVEELQSADSE